MTRSTKPTKSAMLREMLQARSGASMTRLREATGWQPHSVRAALSGLRKAGDWADHACESCHGSGDCINRSFVRCAKPVYENRDRAPSPNGHTERA